MTNFNSIEITEVGPRDGLQNEKTVISTEQKIDFIEKLIKAGCQQIETTSFVSPKWVPQMADAKELMNYFYDQHPLVRLIALIPNLKGFEKALETKLNSIALFTAASESFCQKNIHSSIENSIENFSTILNAAKKEKMWVRLYLSTVFSCPYEGIINPKKVYDLCLRLYEMGANEISLGDTIGVASPKQVKELLELVLKKIPPSFIAMHFHDTRGQALANVLASYQMGIRKFDSSAGGLGGCPYAPGASGNLATEDLVYFCNQMGIETSIDLNLLMQASESIGKILGKQLPSRVFNACQKDQIKSSIN